MQNENAKDIVTRLRSLAHTTRMPVLFVGHGNPMNAIADNVFAKTWENVGRELQVPKAIVVLSAHWTTRGSFVTAMPKPKMIYDFYGFPEEMYQLQYTPPGEPKLAAHIAAMQAGVVEDQDWGLDHGAWSVLMRMFPLAKIPVIQMSIDYNQSPEENFETIKEIRSLRDHGVLFLGSGNIVHNLREVKFEAKPYDWSIEFDQLSKELLAEGDYNSLVHYEKLGSAARMSIPTDDHYRPMLLTLGLTHPDERPIFFNEAIDAASISMRSFVMN